MMAVQKVVLGGGRPIARGQRCLIWVILGVVSLVLFQFWTYEQTWSSDPSTSPESRKALKAMLMKSWFGPKDSDRIDSSDGELRSLREIFTLCNSSSHRDGIDEDRTRARSEECLMKLQENFPSLQPSVVLARAGQPEPCHNGVDKGHLEALQNEVDRLSGFLKNSTVFLDLKDTRESGLTSKDNTWFMSSIHRSEENTGFPEEFEFPSELSQGRLLCLKGNNRSDGTQNKYGFAWKGHLPPGATLLPGLSLVVDNYWDYRNIWHAMSALVGFVSWSGRNGCAVPQRLLLYHWGEHVSDMSSWIDSVLHASFGRKLEVEAMEKKGSEAPLVCLERAVVNRRGLGSMSDDNMNAMFEAIRCKSRKYCDIVLPENTKSHSTHVTLLLRSGPRAFRDSTAVRSTIQKVCGKVGNCDLEVAHASNLSFCEQVALMTRTDVLVTTHGAQMTNMMFMSKGGSVMELIPKGWLEFAGIGQYIYSWLATWSNLHYEGVWRDPEGPDCPYPTTETLKCLLFHKDLEVGHNETQLTKWTTEVLRNFRQRRWSVTPSKSLHCVCKQEDSRNANPLGMK